MSSYLIPRLTALRNAIDKVNEVISNCASFKIGKTHCVSERMNQKDYKGVYPNYDVLFSSPSKELTSYVEAIFIDACMTECPDICDNKKDGNDSINDN